MLSAEIHPPLLNWSGGFLLHDDGACRNPLAMTDVANLELDQIAGPQLAVEPQVEQRQLPDPMFDLQSDADGPYVLQLEGRLLTHQLALVPRFVAGLVGRAGPLGANIWIGTGSRSHRRLS